MCISGKIEYKSKQQAWATKRKMNKNHKKANIYFCYLCKNYHFGRGKSKKGLT